MIMARSEVAMVAQTQPMAQEPEATEQEVATALEVAMVLVEVTAAVALEEESLGWGITEHQTHRTGQAAGTRQEEQEGDSEDSGTWGAEAGTMSSRTGDIEN